MSVGVRERGRVCGRVEWFLPRYWVALGVCPSATSPFFVATGWWRVSLIEGVGVLWLVCIRRILTCCTVSC